MYLSQLSFINFKNYREANFSFIDGVNCFTGHNGAGKTNILDAIHYLCLCKSYFHSIDSQSIFHDEAFFVVQGEFMHSEEQHAVYCGFKRNHKKQFKRNNKEWDPIPANRDEIPGAHQQRYFQNSFISQTPFAIAVILFTASDCYLFVTSNMFYKNRCFNGLVLSVFFSNFHT